MFEADHNVICLVGDEHQFFLYYLTDLLWLNGKHDLKWLLLLPCPEIDLDSPFLLYIWNHLEIDSLYNLYLESPSNGWFCCIWLMDCGLASIMSIIVMSCSVILVYSPPRLVLFLNNLLNLDFEKSMTINHGFRHDFQALLTRALAPT